VIDVEALFEIHDRYARQRGRRARLGQVARMANYLVSQWGHSQSGAWQIAWVMSGNDTDPRRVPKPRSSLSDFT